MRMVAAMMILLEFIYYSITLLTFSQILSLLSDLLEPDMS